MKKEISILFTFLFLINSCIAATIHGTIYDINLNKVKDAIVEVNSEPNQRMVSFDGTYSFNLPVGNYELYAYYGEKNNLQKTKDNISINNDGTFVYDLFLYYDIIGEESILNSSELNFYAPYNENINYTLIFIISLIALLIVFIIFKNLSKKNKALIHTLKQKEEKIFSDDNELNKVILILKEHGGRATQKEIRRNIPLSEAKISLMIAELESEGKIKKIKKGRGNIIVLENNH